MPFFRSCLINDKVKLSHFVNCQPNMKDTNNLIGSSYCIKPFSFNHHTGVLSLLFSETNYQFSHKQGFR